MQGNSGCLSFFDSSTSLIYFLTTFQTRFVRPQITNVSNRPAALLIAVSKVEGFVFVALIIVIIMQNALNPALTTMILFVDLTGKPTFAIAI